MTVGPAPLTPSAHPEWACTRTSEFCRCGREMIRTLERSSVANRLTGEFPMEAWHSCPRYFVPWWRNLLTLGGSGMGHESHSEANPLLAREWR